MKDSPKPYTTFAAALEATNTLWIQPPLPHCLDTLPKLVIIDGRGSGRQGPPPSASAEEPAND